MEENREVKEFKTWAEQIQKIKKHGCDDIESQDFANNLLQKINYYRLTAYFLPFKNTVTQTYNSEEVNLMKIYQIYKFDKELRLILLEVLEEIELFFRTNCAYYHAQEYGPLGFENSQNFNKHHKHEKFMEDIETELEHQQNSLIYKHHLSHYNGKFPIWVIIEFFSFGMLSKFYADLPHNVQSNISEKLSLKNSTVRQYLQVASILRNYCAHFNRIYFQMFSNIPSNIPAFMNEDKNLRHRLMSQLFAIKHLYPDVDEWNNHFISKLEALLTKYASYISLNHIGFTSEWKRILVKKNRLKIES